MAEWLRRQIRQYGAFFWIVVVFTIISGVLVPLAVHFGAKTEEILIGVATGFFTGVVVTIVVAIAQGRQDAAAHALDRRRSLGLATSLDGIDLEGEDLKGIQLRGQRMRMANLRGAVLVNADLSGCQMNDTDFSGADLSGAELEGANFEGADLRSAKLIGASAPGANFKKIRVNEQTDFARADLLTLWLETEHDMKLPEDPHDLTKLIVNYQVLTPAATSFEGAKMYSLEGEHFEFGTLKASKAKYDRNTTWPEFAAEAPTDAIEDNRLADFLIEIERASEEVDQAALNQLVGELKHDFNARWEYRVELLLVDSGQEVLSFSNDLATEDWELVGVTELEFAEEPMKHMIFKRARNTDLRLGPMGEIVDAWRERGRDR